MKYTKPYTTKIGRTLILALMILAPAAVARIAVPKAQAAGCATGEIGSVNASFILGSTEADSYKPWLQLKGSSTATVAVEVDGGTCSTQSVSGLNTSTWKWVSIGSAQAIGAGSHSLKVKVYTDGTSLLGGRLINDSCVPTGDGSNCNTVVVTPVPPTVTSAPPTATPKPPTATPAPPTVTSAPPTATPKPPTTSPTTVYQVGTYNDSLLTYTGSWSVGDNANGVYNKYQGDDRYSSTAGSIATFRFNGAGVTIYGAKAPWHGQAEVSIDGGPAQLIDLYSATRSDQTLLFSTAGLSSLTDHIVSIKVLGTRSSLSSGNTVALDKITVDPQPSTNPPGTKTTTNPAFK